MRSFRGLPFAVRVVDSAGRPGCPIHPAPRCLNQLAGNCDALGRRQSDQCLAAIIHLHLLVHVGDSDLLLSAAEVALAGAILTIALQNHEPSSPPQDGMYALNSSGRIMEQTMMSRRAVVAALAALGSALAATAGSQAASLCDDSLSDSGKMMLNAAG